MNEKPYHHGNLQTELIEEGLALIHDFFQESSLFFIYIDNEDYNIKCDA